MDELVLLYAGSNTLLLVGDPIVSVVSLLELVDSGVAYTDEVFSAELVLMLLKVDVAQT